ncbi:MAG: hypothetical protein Q4B70_15455, partial [Lachnospiraceae bacterium]|nr:hypothetical protein [Lachnospiraceae bacterium]
MIANQIQLKQEINRLPAGNLLCSHNKNRVKWYKSNGAKPIYIPKREFSNAALLALKKYDTLRLEEVTLKLTLIERFLERYQKVPDKASKLLESSSAYHDLLISNFQFDSAFCPDKGMEWISSDFDRNLSHPEHLIHKCISGHKVRSKSEVIIANSLSINKIPYRYECRLNLGDVILYPDFTICHPETNEIYYWEHFGLMDQTAYLENACNKIKLYSTYNIFPSIYPVFLRKTPMRHETV